jgi:ABC-2 type transport system ATP-binding protein
VIEVSALSKHYGPRVAVEGVSFVAREGRVTGFLGPNGAGKSTTLRILLGLDRPTAGTALIGGKPYASLPRPLRTVGAMLDGAGPAPERRAVDHLRWIAQSNRIPARRIGEVLQVVGLADAAKVRVRKYSLGMKQRLGLAAALLGEPDMLVLDEPVNGLDPEGIRTVRMFLREYAAQGHTVLLSSHLMGETADTVDDVVIINQGSVVAQGTLAEITHGHESLERAFFARTGTLPGQSW